jgi:hypothetical protein
VYRIYSENACFSVFSNFCSEYKHKKSQPIKGEKPTKYKKVSIPQLEAAQVDTLTPK